LPPPARVSQDQENKLRGHPGRECALIVYHRVARVSDCETNMNSGSTHYWQRVRNVWLPFLAGVSICLGLGLACVDTAEAGRRQRGGEERSREQEAPSRKEERREERREERQSAREKSSTEDKGSKEDRGSKDGKSEKDEKSSKADNDDDRKSDKKDDRTASEDSSDDKDAEKASNKGGRSQTPKSKVREDDDPPETMAELFRRLSKPSVQPAAVTPASVKPASVKPASATSATTIAAAKKQPVPRARSRAGSPLEMGGRPVPEILALNLKSPSVDKARKLGFTVGASSSHSQLQVRVTSLGVPPGMTVEAAQALLDKELAGDGFVPNRVYTPFRTATGSPANQPGAGGAREVKPAGQNGCAAERCYGPAVIGWSQQLSACAQGVRIGLVDTSVDLTHPAFSGRANRFVSWPENPRSKVSDQHGTSVLSILAGDPKSGTPGLIPDATFYIADVFQPDAQDRPISDTARLLAAFDWLQAQKIDIINLSLAGPPDELMQKTIDQMSRKGIVFVAAAGNGGVSALPSYPAAYKEVVAVTAVSKDLRAYRYANRGDYIDVAAPGVDIWTAVPQAREGLQTGTSFAVPYVTAMLASAYKNAPRKSKPELLSLLATKDLGPPGKNEIYGRGLLLAPTECAPSPVAAKGWMTTVSHGRPNDSPKAETVLFEQSSGSVAGVRPSSAAQRSSFAPRQ
jgi:hypothetical protein